MPATASGPAHRSAATPKRPQSMNCSSTPAGTASSTHTGPTCTNAGTRAAPTPACSTPRSAPTGFTGSDKTVRRYVQPFRATITAPPVGPQPPKARHVARWIMTDPDNLDRRRHRPTPAIIDRSPTIAALVGHVRDFATMMRKRTGVRDLPQWIDKARCRRAARPAQLHQRHPHRPGRRDQRAQPALQLRPRGRTRQPHKDDQAPDVRPGQLRPPPASHPRADLSAAVTEFVPEPFLSAGPDCSSPRPSPTCQMPPPSPSRITTGNWT